MKSKKSSQKHSADQLPHYERDGFPLLEINGEPRCPAEYVEACIGNQKVSDVILRGGTLYYVFENRHELPLTPGEKDVLKREIAATDRQIDGLVYELFKKQILPLIRS